MSLIVKTNKWGSAQQGDVLKVLNSVKDVLNLAFNRSFPGNIFIYQDVKANPITLYEKSSCGAFIINLSATDRYWAQYAYQFAHEYCHVRTNYSIINPRTKWFEETICELASIYALQQMSKVWKIKPPQPNWRSFSTGLAEYAEELVSDPKRQLQGEVSFKVWFQAALPALERNQYLRDSNSLMALQLLPIFEKHPSLWNSMTYWSTWDECEEKDIYSYMQTWLCHVPEKNKKGVEAVIELFK